VRIICESRDSPIGLRDGIVLRLALFKSGKMPIYYFWRVSIFPSCAWPADLLSKLLGVLLMDLLMLYFGAIKAVVEGVPTSLAGLGQAERDPWMTLLVLVAQYTLIVIVMTFQLCYLWRRVWEN